MKSNEEWKKTYCVHVIEDCDENEGGYFCPIYYKDDEDYFEWFCIHPDELEQEMAKGYTQEEAVDNWVNWHMKNYKEIPNWHKNKEEINNE